MRTWRLLVGLLVALEVPAPALAVNQTVTTADNTLFADQAVFVP